MGTPQPFDCTPAELLASSFPTLLQYHYVLNLFSAEYMHASAGMRDGLENPNVNSFVIGGACTFRCLHSS